MPEVAIAQVLLAALLVSLAVVVAPGRPQPAGAETADGPPAQGSGTDVPPARVDSALDVGAVAAALALLALGYRSGLATWRVLEAVAESLDEDHGGGKEGDRRDRHGVNLGGNRWGNDRDRNGGNQRGAFSRAFSDAGNDLRQVAAALRWGAPDSEAWGAVGPAWAAGSRAIQVAHAAGIPPGPVLLSAAEELWRAEVESLELAAAKVGVRLVAPLGLVLLPAFCLTTVVPLVLALARQVLSG
jgi:hypothetical protein